jgi:hypothetical protein
MFIFVSQFTGNCYHIVISRTLVTAEQKNDYPPSPSDRGERVPPKLPTPLTGPPPLFPAAWRSSPASTFVLARVPQYQIVRTSFVNLIPVQQPKLYLINYFMCVLLFICGIL